MRPSPSWVAYKNLVHILIAYVLWELAYERLIIFSKTFSRGHSTWVVSTTQDSRSWLTTCNFFLCTSNVLVENILCIFTCFVLCKICPWSLIIWPSVTSTYQFFIFVRNLIFATIKIMVVISGLSYFFSSTLPLI